MTQFSRPVKTEEFCAHGFVFEVATYKFSTEQLGKMRMLIELQDAEFSAALPFRAAALYGYATKPSFDL
jgi:hypothetical protein